MTYQKITNMLLDLCSRATYIIQKIHFTNSLINQRGISKRQELLPQIREIEEVQLNWTNDCMNMLKDNELLLEFQDFINYIGQPLALKGFDDELNIKLNYMKDRKALLINFAKEIEKRQNRELIILNIDDFDNFKDIKNIIPTDVMAYSKDCFLEDDVENAFLDNLGEPYKELDSGSETRDLFTDRLVYDGKRLATVFMFKGRGTKGELTIDKSGSKGNQLLKLAKNNSAECFIVQHINKINQDVREALIDHILQNTKFSKVYVCFIDGIDTARFLKSVGKDLDELKTKVQHVRIQ